MPAWWVPEGTEGMLPGGPLQTRSQAQDRHQDPTQAEMQPGLEKGVCPRGGSTQSPWG